MPTGDPYGGSITTTSNTGSYWEHYTIPQSYPPTGIPPTGKHYDCIIYDDLLIKERSDNMRYLYEVILVNPKNDDYFMTTVVAKSETSALMEAYGKSQFKDVVKFDDLKTNCKVLMEWKKKDSLEKAIETIKKAVE